MLRAKKGARKKKGSTPCQQKEAAKHVA